MKSDVTISIITLLKVVLLNKVDLKSNGLFFKTKETLFFELFKNYYYFLNLLFFLSFSEEKKVIKHVFLVILVILIFKNRK